VLRLLRIVGSVKEKKLQEQQARVKQEQYERLQVIMEAKRKAETGNLQNEAQVEFRIEEMSKLEEEVSAS
jgi:hypothetical protein